MPWWCTFEDVGEDAEVLLFDPVKISDEHTGGVFIWSEVDEITGLRVFDINRREEPTNDSKLDR